MMMANKANSIVFAVILFLFWVSLIHAGQEILEVNADTAAVRKSPDIESPILVLISQGEKLAYRGKENSWYRISVYLEEKGEAVEGYIHSSFVKVLVAAPNQQESREKRAPDEIQAIMSLENMEFQKSRKRTWVGIKFKCGAGYIRADDINEGTEGFNQLWTDFGVIGGGEVKGELTPFHIVYDFEGDIVFYILPYMGIGFGSGYIYGNQKNEMLLTFPGTEGSWVIEPEIRAIPLRAGLYFRIPLGGHSYFTLDGGAGWYMVDYFWNWRGEGGAGFWMEMNQETSAQDMGYHGGMGFEIGLGPHFAFLLEGRVRYAKISGFEGSLQYRDSFGSSDEDEGILYYWKEKIIFNQYTFVFVSESDTPSYTGLGTPESLREAVVDLTGVYIQAGFKINF
ncbi:MAG: SH3 domain-containing protein [Candidatus Aminicenantes bacterium]|nr:SH3 domain-containing protein [Candidatus Aminicenantes bacterium]